MNDGHLRKVVVRPLLIRKRQAVALPRTVRTIERPLITKRSSVVVITPAPSATRSPAAAKLAAVATRQTRKQPTKVKKQVRYVTKDVGPDSLAKIRGLRGTGAGRVLVIIGNGPSLAQVDLRPLAALPNVDLMSINKPDERVWPTRYWCFCDHSQLRRHDRLWSAYDGVIFNSTAIKSQRPGSLQIKNLGGIGFSRDLTKGFHIGKSTVYAAMQIAHWLGHRHVYLFGVDMDASGINGNLHFYGTNPDVNPEVRASRFAREAEYYQHAAGVLSSRSLTPAA